LNAVPVSVEDFPPLGWESRLEEFALAVLERLGRDGIEVSFLLCDDSTMADLNFGYRGKEGPTDVLSFAQSEGADFPNGNAFPNGNGTVYSGDVAISLDTLDANSRLFAVAPDEELRRLAIHGILHLEGMDHPTNDEDEPMLRLQESILRELADLRILDGRISPRHGGGE